MAVPELPVLAFRRREGGLEAVLFNHSTHTIGTRKPGVRSPSFYGLAAQELEKARGGTFLFFEGASGSTHNLDVPAAEAAYRIREAVAGALDVAREYPVDRVDAIRKEINVKVRQFREEVDDGAVVDYCTKRIKDPATARWQYAAARMTNGAELRLRHQDKQVWEARPRPWKDVTGSHKLPHTAFEFPRLPNFLDQAVDKPKP